MRRTRFLAVVVLLLWAVVCVGVVRKSRYTDQFDNDPLIRKVDADNYLQIVRLLKIKPLDAGVGAIAGLFYSAHRALKRLNQRGEIRKIIDSYMGEYQFNFATTP